MFYSMMRALLRTLYRMIFRIELIGLHHVPTSGPTILCANHISNFDPPNIGIHIERQINYMAKKELFQVPGLGAILRALGCVPVNRSAVSLDAIKTAVNTLKEGKLIAIFPEGTRNSTEPPKKGAAMIALRAKAQVVPIAIVGRYRLFGKMKLVYGEALDLTPYYDSKQADTLDVVTSLIMQRINELKEQHKF